MMSKIKSFDELKNVQKKFKAGRDPKKPSVTICGGTGCLAYGTQKLIDSFREELAKRNLTDKIDFRTSGCHGFCERGPMVVVGPENIFYQRVGLGDAAEIIDKTLLKGEVIDRLLYVDPATGEKIVHEEEVPFYKKQTRLVFGLNFKIDPQKLEDYLAIDGYSALGKALTMKPEEIIQEVIKANLRGRGGGGFPAGWKWDETRKAEGEPKYVICNADEGDPGAYMDRSLLEGNPHLILEGMIIGAYAIGSSEGYIYVRNEYPLAVSNITRAMQQAREAGLLGKNILGSNFSFDVKINRGGGAFVCGESSALFASLEGRAGEPRAKYIHATHKGLYDKPTNLNNVETWANVPFIINRGADWYASMGTAGSKGTKIFSLVGKINNTGLVEVPMGTTLRKIVFEIGGGIPGGRKFKAIQTGGPSGGCIPEQFLDMPVDFDELVKIGSMMGSGGMIVMDDQNCMVNIAKYFTNFLVSESCGKCVPCREGIRRMRDILVDITEGRGQEGDVELLESISQGIKDGALCALGNSAPNPVLSTIRYFRNEYVAHIKEKRCPAGVCRDLITYSVDPEKCTGCTVCSKVCPTGAAGGARKKVHTIDPAK
ncbi:MAG: NADH-ubiquinone oxidoreductase-F iron-sulfur binding region domain-containing protein, partial [Syntrophales bacterium]|nr:NADH-ubiquinone oxidoreductase-F iron-sulfur binding region domain-containing protein [Syntrophales bacterium]